MPQTEESMKNVLYHVSTFIDNELDRKIVTDSITAFKLSKDVKNLTNTLKSILDKPERLQLYDVVRRVVPLELQSEYNRNIPSVNAKSRPVKLTRPRGGTSFGFSIRGGKEHGIGVYVSEVENGSEAFHKGLLVGDHILRVNGMTLEEAIHDEVIRLIKSRTMLLLEVRSIGMLPVKKISTVTSVSLERLYKDEPLNDFFFGPVNLSDDNDAFLPLTPDTNRTQAMQRNSVTSFNNFTPSRKDSVISWKLVSNNVAYGNRNNMKVVPTSSLASSGSEYTEVKYFIDLTGKQKFSCSICKGPRERPGIFVYSTRDDGLAKDAGLQPGDQILEANGRVLMHMSFAEAVEYLKTRDTVELLVRKRVAADMFPGESSGYNSSNSSAHDDPLSPTIFHDNSLKVADDKRTSNSKDAHNNEVVTAQIEKSDAGASTDNDTAESESECESVKSQEIIVQPKHVVAFAAVAAVSEIKSNRRESLDEKIPGLDERKAELLRAEEEDRRKREEKMAEKKRSAEYASRLESQMLSEAIQSEAESEIHKRGSERQMSVIAISDKATFYIRAEDMKPYGRETEDTEHKVKFVKNAVTHTKHPIVGNDGTSNSRDKFTEVKSPDIVKSALQIECITENVEKELSRRQSHDKVVEEFHRVQNKMYELAQKLDQDDGDIQEDEIMPLRSRRPSLYVPHLSPSTHASIATEQPMKLQPNPMAIVENREGSKEKITDSKPKIPKPPNYFFPKMKADAKVVVTISAYQSRTNVNQQESASQRLQFLKSHPSIEVVKNGKSTPVSTPKVLDKPVNHAIVVPVPPQPPRVTNTKVFPAKSNFETTAQNSNVSKVTLNQTVITDNHPNNSKSKAVLARWQPNIPKTESLSTIERVSKRQRTPSSQIPEPNVVL